MTYISHGVTVPRHGRVRVWLLAILFAVDLATPARAGVRVEGNPTALRVTADGAAVSDVLSAFADNFNVTYRSAIPLDAPASGAYAGSFSQVVARLLDGYNFMVKNDRGTTEIVVFGVRGQMAVPAPAPKAARPAGILSRWR